MQNDDYTTSEWTRDEWERAWHLDVGKAYSCAKCDAVVMITKGGVGTLEPYCCDELMSPVDTSQA